MIILRAKSGTPANSSLIGYESINQRKSCLVLETSASKVMDLRGETTSVTLLNHHNP